MESYLSSYSPKSVTYVDYLKLLLLRPILAISFAFSMILLGWFLAWKLVLVHVPLVQEICGLLKKPVKPKPVTHRRLSRFYSGTNANNSTSGWICVLNNQGLKEEVLSEAYRSKYTIHPGNSNLRENYWWNWMKGDITNFIFKCFVLLTS